jgi:hypothetical protein
MIINEHKNYISLIEGLPGSKLFQHVYAREDKSEEIDIMQGGVLSCAYVVSSVLKIIDWIDRPHATVISTVKWLKNNGWSETKVPVAGTIVVWPVSNKNPAHIGFYLDENRYVSNSSFEKLPVLHSAALFDGRLPDFYLTHPKIGDI